MWGNWKNWLKRRKWKLGDKLVVFGVVLVAILSYRNAYYQSTTTQPTTDEVDSMERTEYLQLIGQGDFRHESWRSSLDQPIAGYLLLGWLNPRGTRLAADAYTNLLRYDNNRDPLQTFDSFSAYYKDNFVGIKRATFVESRSIPVLFIVFDCILLMIVGVVVGEGLAGFIAALILSFNTTFLGSMAMVTNDAYLVFFILLGMVVFYIFQRHKIRRNIFIATLTGLAVAVKLNGLLLPIALFGAYFYETKSIVKSVKVFLVWVLLGMAVFVALNPYTWNNPLKGVVTYYLYRMRVVDYQMHQVSNSGAVLGNIIDSLKAVTSNLSLSRGLIVVGGGILLARASKTARELSLIALLIIITNLLYMKLSWFRYEIPIVLMTTIFQGKALSWAVFKGFDLVFSRPR